MLEVGDDPGPADAGRGRARGARHRRPRLRGGRRGAAPRWSTGSTRRSLDAQDRPFRDGRRPRRRPFGARRRDRRGPSDRQVDRQAVARADGTTFRTRPASATIPKPLPELPDVGQRRGRATCVDRDRHRAAPSTAARRLPRARPPTLPRRRTACRFQAISMDDVDETARRLRRVYFAHRGRPSPLPAPRSPGSSSAAASSPIDSMIETAGAIAAGDLTRRVDHPADGTELGRLGGALDEMLGQLEAAFAERAASEDRLKRFAADASHELRTPLTAIRGLRRALPQGRAARGRGAGTGHGPHRGRVDPHGPPRRGPPAARPPRPAAPARAGAGRPAASSCSTPPPTTGPSATTTPSPSKPTDAGGGVGDESRLRQVIGNLLANARTHTPGGARRSTWPCGPTRRGGRCSRSPTRAPASPPSTLDRVFERFHRGDPSRARPPAAPASASRSSPPWWPPTAAPSTAANAEDGGALVTVRLPLAPALPGLNLPDLPDLPDNWQRRGTGSGATRFDTPRCQFEGRSIRRLIRLVEGGGEGVAGGGGGQAGDDRDGDVGEGGCGAAFSQHRVASRRRRWRRW